MFLPVGLGVRFVRGGGEGGVRQGHGVVEEQGFVPVFPHEGDEVVRVEIRPEGPLACAAALRAVEVGVCVAVRARRIAGFLTGPHQPIVKAVVLHGLRVFAEIIDLPFSGRGGGVAGLAQEAGDGGVARLGPIEIADPPARHVPVIDPAIAPRIGAGEEGDARRGALGHGPGVVEFHAAGGEGVDVRGADVFRAVAGDPFLAEVVGEDEEDVGRRLRAGGVEAEQQQQGKEKAERVHGVRPLDKTGKTAAGGGFLRRNGGRPARQAGAAGCVRMSADGSF